jgi:FkbM family methyltransferase
MGIVSYAQNFEDVMLWRALGDAGPGFWIDVGAADPSIHSVTRAFSERGWHGINIEPRVQEFDLLRASRPAEITLNLAVAAAPGRMLFHDCADAGLSTLDSATAARLCAEGRDVTTREVEVTTLAEICRAHAPTTVHFLKVDVEGAERAVLEGADFTACRPWIVLVEATIPLTRTDASAEWEPILLASDYRFAWFDGLNRFYLAAERWDALSPHFTTPPNVFDGFTLAGTEAHLAEIELARLRAENALLRLAPGRAGSLPTRIARRLRDFLSAELRQEIEVLRQDIARLGVLVEAARDKRSEP